MCESSRETVKKSLQTFCFNSRLPNAKRVLPVIKATMRLFLYSTGAKKYIYLNIFLLYMCIHASVPGETGRLFLFPAGWKNGANLCHPDLRIIGEKGAKRGSLREPWSSDCIQVEGLWACMRWSFTGQELPSIYSLSPFNHLIFFSLSQTLCICNMICIYFYNNLHKVNGDVLLDIIE